ncbi:(2Fe-2S)-binding protein [Fuerstiella marisgermanici]|uniref:(2Fe-2S)-binding protein n=1 Tax=Fuerstiella marisgermanici TaxID=1891926 RepID=UPI0009F9A2E1
MILRLSLSTTTAVPVMQPSQPNDLLCRCLGITESEVRAATDYAGCRTLCDIKKTTSAGTGCMSCHRRIKAVLQETVAQTNHSPADSPT